ncbi:MAG: lysine--tRNA ligase [Candidatus Bathyarchaeota archaeon]|nr:lysine--tRNA ligase [Candidatus Bathyarchaeota archaeon]
MKLRPIENKKIIGRGTWYDKAAEELIKREKKLGRSLDKIRTESGLGASGYPHIGSMADGLRNYGIALALENMGYNSEYIAFADDKDGLRKVPGGMSDELEKWLGYSVATIPDIFGDCHFSFGEHMSSLLKEALDYTGVKYTPMSAYKVYQEGILNDEIIKILDNHKKVGEIIERVSGQEKYNEALPYFVVCEKCGRIYTTQAHDYNPSTKTIKYDCDGMEVKGQWLEGCGHSGEVDVTSGNGKLSWKVEFAARWHALDIRFEAYGKDIADSVHVNDAICREIFDWEPPMHVQYEMFVDRGGKKISKSAGNVFTPQVWYMYGSKESLNLLIYKRFVGTKSGSVDDISVHMDELDDLEDVYFGKKKIKDEAEYYKLTGLYEYAYLLNPPEEPQVHIPFNLMVKLARFAPKGAEAQFMKAKLEEYNYFKDTSKGIDERIQRIISWVNDFEEEDPVKADLSDEERQAIEAIITELKTASNEDEYQATIFNVSKALGMKARQIFPIIYTILIGKRQGPRFGPYVDLVGKENVIKELESSLRD